MSGGLDRHAGGEAKAEAFHAAARAINALSVVQHR